MAHRFISLSETSKLTSGHQKRALIRPTGKRTVMHCKMESVINVKASTQCLPEKVCEIEFIYKKFTNDLNTKKQNKKV